MKVTFEQCEIYAINHNIAFQINKDSNDNIYCLMSDGADGYLTACYCYFTYRNYYHRWYYYFDLNVRWAYAKDHHLADILCAALDDDYDNVISKCSKSKWYGHE